MKLVTELVTELREQFGVTDRPIEVLYALGIGERSPTGARDIFGQCCNSGTTARAVLALSALVRSGFRTSSSRSRDRC
ncbi:MAG TPA: hypothetical protein VM347_38805 [Nonomuraea sp.]|nr:hypothetical protein [Nonomuraea sp.]